VENVGEMVRYKGIFFYRLKDFRCQNKVLIISLSYIIIPTAFIFFYHSFQHFHNLQTFL
jgi:hypothetical protein